MGGHVEMHGGHLDPVAVERIIFEESERSMHAAIGHALAEVMQRMARHRRTGHMMRGTAAKVTRAGGMVIGVIGNSVFYTKYLEEGTGLYGPRNSWIVPVRARFLRFPQPGNSGFTLAGRQRQGRAGAGAAWVYARRVRGIRPIRMFYDAAFVSRPLAMREFEMGARRISERIGLQIQRGSA